jgi:hypothetical protein
MPQLPVSFYLTASEQARLDEINQGLAAKILEQRALVKKMKSGNLSDAEKVAIRALNEEIGKLHGEGKVLIDKNPMLPQNVLKGLQVSKGKLRR